jgi:hypothetical protein
MADGGRVGRSNELAELLFLQPGRLLVRATVATVAVAACCVLGALSLSIQGHFAAEPVTGRVGALLAHGSTAATAWTGWAAAAFFGVALWRLRRGVPEPPVGITPVESLSPAQLRRGLVREYTAVRVGLTVLVAVTLTDTARAGRYVVGLLGGDPLARSTAAATLVEALGLVVASIVLGTWALSFRRQLVRVRALDS